MGNVYIEQVAIADIMPYPGNPRRITEGIAPVKASIERFGFRIPILLDSQNVIICGHTRLEAAKQLNMPAVPCIRVEDLSDSEMKAFRLVDNKVAEYSSWDYEALAKELEGLPGVDLSQFNFPPLSDLQSAFEGCSVMDDDFIQKSDFAPITDNIEKEPGVTCPFCGKQFEV